MPLTLTLTHRPRLRLHQETPETREPWQVLHAEAGDLERQLDTLWLSAFLDFRSALDVSTLARAVQHGALPTEHALWSAWHGVTQEQTRLPLQTLFQSSAQRIQDALTPGLQQLLEVPGLRFDVPTPDMTQFIDQYVGHELVAVTETTRAQVRQIVRQAVASGRTHRQAATALREVVGLTPRQTAAVDALRQRLTDEGRSEAYITSQVELAADRGIRLRASQVARTESMTVANAAQQQLNEQAQEGGWLPADQKRQWLITPDQRLCFCGGTMVVTPKGERPIEVLRTGDLVCTPEGERQLLATLVRPYDGMLVVIQTSADRLVIMTADHPVWVRGEWCEAVTLQPGDVLQTADQQPLYIVAAFHVRLQNMQNCPPRSDKSSVAPGFFLRILVPVIPIDFQGNPPLWQGKINRVTSNGIFLDKRHLQEAQYVANQPLWACFIRRGTVTAEAAELPVSGTWDTSKVFPACLTDHHVRWPATDFRTIDAPLLPFARELFPAAFTDHSDRVSQTTGPGTHHIAIRNDLRYGEGYLTHRACFTDQDARVSFLIARSGTEESQSFSSCALRHAERLEALFTDKIAWAQSYEVETCSRAIRSITSDALFPDELLMTISTVVGERHKAYLSNIVYSLANNNSIPVYDIEVESAHQFYAAGFLVHNCSICAPIPGMNPGGVALDEPFATPEGPTMLPPLHVNCRCTLTLVM